MILAVDPGIAKWGWSVIGEPARVIAIGMVDCPSKPKADESTDRVRRARIQAAELRAVAREHAITAIAAEAMSFGGPPSSRVRMAVSLGLSWGVLSALAEELGVPLYEVRPKQWQHAVVPEAGDDAIDYDVVFKRLLGFVAGQARAQLLAIARSNRNHALDAAAVGLFATLRPGEATLIAGPPRSSRDDRSTLDVLSKGPSA